MRKGRGLFSVFLSNVIDVIGSRRVLQTDLSTHGDKLPSVIGGVIKDVEHDFLSRTQVRAIAACEDLSYLFVGQLSHVSGKLFACGYPCGQHILMAAFECLAWRLAPWLLHERVQPSVLGIPEVDDGLGQRIET